MSSNGKVLEALEKTKFFWQVMDLSEEEQIEVAKMFLLTKGEVV